MPLSPGDKLGRYEIVELIGKGGMGEVYRARDPRLNRDVAIKISIADFSERFEREAKVIAQLNHPHICQIYDVGPNYLVMEFLEGRQLNGPLPLDKALRYAGQIADALDDAHSKGITHRDLKPSNILVIKTSVKLLDFGLAKIQRPVSQSEETVTEALTAAGAIVGTLNYMSPEQLQGKDADARSDIFSFGLVLYEIVTGKRAFEGASPAGVIAAILERPAPTVEPGHLNRVIATCLAKDPAERFQTARDLKRALEWNGMVPSEAGNPVRQPRKRWLWPAVAALLAVLVGIAIWAPWRAASLADSIAVLPFVNGGGDPEVEYLSDGITDSLINALSEVPSLTVMSRNAVFRYKGRETDAQEVGRKLNVQAVLTGRVVQRGESLAISTELIDARNNHHLWGEQYNRPIQDVQAVQAEISTEIARRLRLPLTNDERTRLTRQYTENTEAYQLYLQGRFYWNKKTADGFSKGAEYFQKAIETDPNYAPAYAGLAALYNNEANYNFALIAPREAWAKAKTAAEKAVQLDDSLASAHTSLALVAFQWAWDWPTAEKEFQRSLQLNRGTAATYDPNPSSTNHWYSHYLMAMKRTEESIRAGRRALELDPVDLANVSHEGWSYIFTREYDRAPAPLLKTIEMNPNFSLGHWYLGVDYELIGAPEKAIPEFEAAIRATDGNPSMIALLGHAHAVAGKRPEAEAVLRRLRDLSQQRYVPSYPVAVIYAAMGQRDEAFRWLEKAWEERDSWMAYLGTDPRLDNLRRDARFAGLMKRMNLPL
jgi:serine/threonine-protein kinase